MKTNLSEFKPSIEDLNSVTDVEIAFGTTRLLPEIEQIPIEFMLGNAYTELSERLFTGRPISGEIALKDGVKPDKLNRAVRAHLRSFDPKHEHKIAGVGLLIRQFAEITPK